MPGVHDIDESLMGRNKSDSTKGQRMKLGEGVSEERSNQKLIFAFIDSIKLTYKIY